MKKILVVALMAIVAIMVFADCSKNPTSSNSDSVGISVVKSNTFGDRTASNPTNPIPGSPTGPPYNADAGIGVTIGVFDVMSDVDRVVSQFSLLDSSGGMEAGQLEQYFKNMRLLTINSEFSALQLGTTIVDLGTTPYGALDFNLTPPFGLKLKLIAHKWVTIYIIADVKSLPITDIKVSGVGFYSVTAAICDKNGAATGPQVEYFGSRFSFLGLQTIYLLNHE